MDTETKVLMREMAEEAAKAACREMMVTFGVDADNPIEVQKDMASLRELRLLCQSEDYQKDMLHLRTWRKTMEGVRKKGMLTATGLVITGACAAIWIGIQSKLPGIGQ